VSEVVVVVAVVDVEVDVDEEDNEDVVVRRVLGFVVEADPSGVETDCACTGAAGVAIADWDGTEAGAAAAGAGATGAGATAGAGAAEAVRRFTDCRRTRSTRRWCGAWCARRAGAAVVATAETENAIGEAGTTGGAVRRVGAGASAASRDAVVASVVSPPLPGAKPGQEPVKTTRPVSTTPSATASALTATAVPAPSASSRRMRGEAARSREGNSTTS
jgi:hypothetical protein